MRGKLLRYLPVGITVLLGIFVIYSQVSLMQQETRRIQTNDKLISVLEKDLENVRKLVDNTDPTATNTEARKHLILADMHLQHAKMKNSYDGWVGTELMDTRWQLERALEESGLSKDVLTPRTP